MPNIVDIDDTIVKSGRPVQRVIDYVNRLDGPVYIVTGRNTSQRASTERLLKAIGIRYTRLIMSPGGNPNSFKGAVAKRLGNIKLAIDNNPDARKAYKDAGVKRVLDPADI